MTCDLCGTEPARYRLTATDPRLQEWLATASPEARAAAIRAARRDALAGSERGDDSQLSLFGVEGEAAA